MSEHQKNPIVQEQQEVDSLVERIKNALRPVCELLDEARAKNMPIVWDSLQPGPQGKTVVMNLRVLRTLWPREF